MTPLPIHPGEGAFPVDQIYPVQPPSRFQSSQGGVLRCSPRTPTVESYRRTVVRIWPDGVESTPVDLVPAPGETTSTPEDLFGVADPVYIVSGMHSFDRLTTRDDDAASLLTLRERLEGWRWCPSVSTSPDRQWVEGGAVVREDREEAVLYFAAYHGQGVVLRWDEGGMVPLPTRRSVDVGGSDPVAVRIVPALTGCPMRCGADGVCKVYGGPWTSSAISAAMIWQQHRAMLLDAFGCDVCDGEGGPHVGSAVDLFTPSRSGGWQFGPPRTSIAR